MSGLRWLHSRHLLHLRLTGRWCGGLCKENMICVLLAAACCPIMAGSSTKSCRTWIHDMAMRGTAMEQVVIAWDACQSCSAGRVIQGLEFLQQKCGRQLPKSCQVMLWQM